ncbi:hypothetical protein ACF06V_38050 [Streptomyces bobili]|uniref:hypothetical protein n=1 Tax=Streptomyces bobili TaxID=67280 RepID=UPI003702ADCC
MAGDLERNIKEQERLSVEIEALQKQLAALRHGHTILVNLQQALAVPTTAAEPAAHPAATVPVPRRKAAPAQDSAEQTKAKKPAGRKPAAKKNTATAPAAPTLVTLVREHLAGQSEPRSSAGIATALDQKHPERAIKTTVVRTTIEGLVAKSQAQRTKQGSSAFYTASGSAEAATDDKQSPQPSA